MCLPPLIKNLNSVRCAQSVQKAQQPWLLDGCSHDQKKQSQIPKHLVAWHYALQFFTVVHLWEGLCLPVPATT